MVPKIITRPALAQWMFERGLKPKDAAGPLNCSSEQVRRICLPFGNEDRRVPDEDLLRRVVAWTAGDVTAADFYPRELTRGVFEPKPGETYLTDAPNQETAQ